ncbi:hypothetical protein [Streptomyces profundus]|uniref:hypothetical protein n=1 Tax=Streptomyces profundus TaxID=2867410 RepID=UPI001D16667C|nr:hypothetical protein [Streptomyces sp. MA3_2.13]UED87794.1 hypothetical protein K4G22_29330 [Streptomyces sp. MA3_2.13]
MLTNLEFADVPWQVGVLVSGMVLVFFVVVFWTLVRVSPKRRPDPDAPRRAESRRRQAALRKRRLALQARAARRGRRRSG